MVLAGILALPAQAQQASALRPAVPASAPPDKMRAFFSCLADACRASVPTEDVTFVQWVRDLGNAEVSILVTQQPAGGGGVALTVVAAGVRELRADTLTFTLPPGVPAHDARNELGRWMRIALLRVVAARSGEGLDVRYTPSDAPSAGPSGRDPWRNWTVTVGGNAQIDDQQQSSLKSGSLGAVANRVTPDWRASFGGGFATTATRTTLSDSSEYRTRSRTDNFAALIVKSLDDHWSIGGRASTSRSDYLNQDRVMRIAAALEYDVFPYSVATHRQFTFRYQVGTNHYRYADTTVFGVLKETRPNHRIVAAYATQSLWGSIDSDLTWSSFLDKSSFYALLLEITGNLTLAKGLALSITGTASRVNDQIYLRRTGLTDAEILAQQRALATTYHATLSLGLTYTFGSIFSSVVNPRFAGTSVSTSGRVPTTGF